jgi:hypothetical protein
MRIKWRKFPSNLLFGGKALGELMLVKPDDWELVAALVQRKDMAGDVRSALRQAYPDAPPAMIDTATFHIAVDGVDAAVHWLVAVEQFVREPSKGLDYGATWHLLYHLYNWQQFQSLLPHGREGMMEFIKDAKLHLSEGDTEALAAVLKQMEEMFQGGLQAPQFK